MKRERMKLGIVMMCFISAVFLAIMAVTRAEPLHMFGSLAALVMGTIVICVDGD